jgi:hypothetical protein
MQLLPLPIEGDDKFYKAIEHAIKEVQQTYDKPTCGLNLQIANAKKSRDE